MCLAAVQQNGRALRYASEGQRLNRVVVDAAMENNTATVLHWRGGKGLGRVNYTVLDRFGGCHFGLFGIRQVKLPYNPRIYLAFIYIYRYIGSLFCICGNWTSCWPCVAEWHLLVRNFEKWNSAIKTYSEPSLLFNVHGWLFKANPLGDQEQLIRAEVLRMMMLTL